MSKLEDKNNKETFREQLSYYTGQVSPCAKNPEFPKDHGLKPPYMIDLRQKAYRGIRIIEYRENAKILQLPGWDDFGWLGLHTVDDIGNIYVSSVPHESIVHNPIGEQNRILKLDHKSGELFEFIKLPQKKPSNLKNPFGAMGVHFDCDNGYLYTSSIAGSGLKEELGSIFQVDLKSKDILSALEYTDAIGLATFNTRNGKRLYFGKARNSDIYSVSIEHDGSIGKDVRFEFSLIEQTGGADDRAHRIRFEKNKMEIKANEFNFTLAAASDPQFNIYTFQYIEKSDSWKFIDVHLLKHEKEPYTKVP